MDEKELAALREAGAHLKNMTAYKNKQSIFAQVVSKWGTYFNTHMARIPQMSNGELEGLSLKFQEAADEITMFLAPAEQFARLGFGELLASVHFQLQDKQEARLTCGQILAGRQRTAQQMYGIQSRAMTEIVGMQMASNEHQRQVYDRANNEYTNAQRYPAGHCRHCRVGLNAGFSYEYCPACGNRL